MVLVMDGVSVMDVLTVVAMRKATMRVLVPGTLGLIVLVTGGLYFAANMGNS
jgi:hypothetical protein